MLSVKAKIIRYERIVYTRTLLLPSIKMALKEASILNTIKLSTDTRQSIKHQIRIQNAKLENIYPVLDR